MQVRVLIRALVSVAMLALVSTASAEPIYYIVNGTGSGQFQGSPVTDLQFTVTVLADTDDVVEYVPGLFVVNNQSVTLQVGANTYTDIFTGSSWRYSDGVFSHEPNPIGGESDTPLF